MSTDPVFNSPDLQAAFTESKGSIESLKTNLDLISRDIKAIEEYLTNTGLRIPVRVRFDFQGIHRDTQPQLHWAEHQESSKWRLFYYEFWRDNDDDPHSENRPLIEMPAAVRVAAYPSLPVFLKVIAAKVKVEPLTNRLDPDNLEL